MCKSACRQLVCYEPGPRLRSVKPKAKTIRFYHRSTEAVRSYARASNRMGFISQTCDKKVARDDAMIAERSCVALINVNLV